MGASLLTSVLIEIGLSSVVGIERNVKVARRSVRAINIDFGAAGPRCFGVAEEGLVEARVVGPHSPASGRAGLKRLWVRDEVYVGDSWKAAALPRMAALRVAACEDSTNIDGKSEAAHGAAPLGVWRS